MEKRGPTAGSGNYGQACMQCFKAKCRCIPRPDGGACERCLRLKKPCQPSNSVRRRTAPNGQTGAGSAEIAKLEDRINTLTTMLQSVMEKTGLAADAPTAESQATTATLLSGTETAGATESAGQTTTGSSDAASLSSMSFDRPLLMQAIVAVATPSTKLKAERAERLKQTLTRCAVIENQSNIDLLLGILTYITWSTDPFQQAANNLSRMTMLAISLVYDLQHASRVPPAPDAQVIAIMTPGFERPGGSGIGLCGAGLSMQLPTVLERQRAFLACFVLSSIVSSSFGRMVALKWTTQMEEGLQLVQKMASQGLCPSDSNFAVQVRLQIVIQRAALVREQVETDRCLASTNTTTTPVSTNLYMKVLQGQLKDLRNSFSPDLQRRDMLLIYTHYAELCLNEVTRLASSEAPLAPAPGQTGHAVGASTGTNDTLPALEHIECLWRSVYAIKAWLDAYQAIPPLTYVGVPFFFWFQLVRCVVLLKHLATFNDPAWDGQAVRNAVDMSTMLEWMAVKAEMASKEAGEQSDDDLFRRVGSMMRSSMAWMAAKQRAAGITTHDATHTNQPPVQQSQYDTAGAETSGDSTVIITDAAEDDLMVPVDPSWAGSFGMPDENWIEEMFGWPMASI
ncbi:hypothetical protein Sste5344_000047 [Sporothrix stenoceras]